MKRLFLLTVILAASVIAQAAPKADITLADYIAKAKARAEKSGKEFNEEKVKKQFAKRDANGDGVISVDEQIPPPKAAPAVAPVAAPAVAPVTQ